MGTVAVYSSTYGQCAPPRRSCQIFLPRHETLLPPTKCCGLPSLSCSAKRTSSAIRIGTVRFGFGAVESRGLGLEGVRNVVVRAQEEKEQLEVEKVEEKSLGKHFCKFMFDFNVAICWSRCERTTSKCAQTHFAYKFVLISKSSSFRVLNQ